ncbi:hypothetical protein T4D_10629, partial [Trichinella pseudospiralis]
FNSTFSLFVILHRGIRYYLSSARTRPNALKTVRTRTTRSRSQCARSTIKQDQRYMRRFPVGPNSVSQGKGYLEKVKLSHSSS